MRGGLGDCKSSPSHPCEGGGEIAYRLILLLVLRFH